MMRTQTEFFVIAAVAFAKLASADEDLGLCCLCDNCDLAAPGRGDLKIDPYGLTCDLLAVQMADPTNESTRGSKSCKELKERFADTCCNPNVQALSVIQVPAEAAVVNLPQGNEPRCDLCEDGSFPGTPHTITAVLYIPGHPTCEKLYWMGRTGNILDKLCNPLVDYMQEPCGCGKFYPKNKNKVKVWLPPSQTAPASTFSGHPTGTQVPSITGVATQPTNFTPSVSPSNKWLPNQAGPLPGSSKRTSLRSTTKPQGPSSRNGESNQREKQARPTGSFPPDTDAPSLPRYPKTHSSEKASSTLSPTKPQGRSSSIGVEKGGDNGEHPGASTAAPSVTPTKKSSSAPLSPPHNQRSQANQSKMSRLPNGRNSQRGEMWKMTMGPNAASSTTVTRAKGLPSNQARPLSVSAVNPSKIMMMMRSRSNRENSQLGYKQKMGMGPMSNKGGHPSITSTSETLTAGLRDGGTAITSKGDSWRSTFSWFGTAWLWPLTLMAIC